SAFYSNNYIYTEDYLKVPVFQYPIHARSLEAGKTYAWLIESRMGSLELKSEPTVFVVSTPSIPEQKKVIKSLAQYSQYIDLQSANALEIQIVNTGGIPIMLENRGAPYQLMYCITGSKAYDLIKGKMTVNTGLNKLLIPAGDLHYGAEEMYYLK